jgi:LPS-assembly protein
LKTAHAQPISRSACAGRSHPSRSLGELSAITRAVHGALAALAVGAVCVPAWAQQNAAPVTGPLKLRSNSDLVQQVPKSDLKSLPVFAWGESLEGEMEGVSVFKGNAELRRHDAVMRADEVSYDKRTADVKARGNVLLNRNGDRFTGPSLDINLDTYKGEFSRPSYDLLKNEGKGDARKVDFLDEHRMLVHDGRYSTCPRQPGVAWMPDWLIRATSMELDRAEDIGVARSGVLEFQGVPILGSPIFSFPLSDKRKTGALPPSLDISSQDGLELSAPYYFNIAPHLDATVTPTLMSRRGLELTSEFRYLQPGFSGALNATYMPSDRLRDQDRWGVSYHHEQKLVESLAGGPLGLRLLVNRVGDDNHWRDFPRSIQSLTSRLLASEAVLSWVSGPWSASGGAYAWQTLQDASAPISAPFDRLPSVSFGYLKNNQTLLGDKGWDVSMQSNVTRFKRSETIQSVVKDFGGDRATVAASLMRRWQTPGWFVKPQAKMHLTQYRNDIGATPTADASRSVPTFSVDSGLVFERPVSLFGRNLVQTLEPRAFFTWTPFRDQSALPNYDSGARDYSFTSLYSENTFVGDDRISDTRGVTLGLASSFLDADTGAEAVRLEWAQRALFEDEKVTLPGVKPVSERLGDSLLGARFNWKENWSLETLYHYNLKSRTSRRSSVGAYYQPGPYKVVSATYSVQRGTSELLDLGWQWPLASLTGASLKASPGQALGPGRWYGVGRLNYSLREQRIVDMVAGFEYDAGCWIGRIVVENVQLSATKSDKRIRFQLEFDGLSSIGRNTLRSLQDHVPKYRYLREDTPQPNRFQLYD